MDPTKQSPCFIQQDDGLASFPHIETDHRPSRTATCGYARRGTLRNLVSSPRYTRFYDSRFDEFQPHFLEACFLCHKPLAGNRDIFMYRGDTPFCSEECRQEQIDNDEAKENNWNLSSAMKALRKKDQRKSSPTKSQGYSSHTGTVAAA